MAGRGGARPGTGPKKGTKFRQTLEAELAAATAQLEALTRARQEGKELAIDVLEQCMHLSRGLAAKHQPLAPNEVAHPNSGRDPNEEKFLQYFGLTIESAGKLANYQSPKYKSVTISAETSPGGAAAQSNAPVAAMSAQEAYRRLRDSDMIDITPVSSTTAPKAIEKPKKAARG